MAKQILLPVDDARRIADLLRDGEGGEADFYADYLSEHADKHSFDDRWDEIGPMDEFLAENQTADEL